MKSKFINLILLLVLLIIPSVAKADPITSLNGFYPPKGKWLLRQLNRWEESATGSSKLGVLATVTILSYSPTDRIKLISLFGWASTETRFTDPNTGAEGQIDGAGLIDTRVYFGYDILRVNQKKSQHAVTAFLGLWLPTGEIRQSNSLQPGLETQIPFNQRVSPSYALAYRYTNLDYQFDTYMELTHFVQDDSGLALGNRLVYQASLSRRIFPWTLSDSLPKNRLDFILEMSGLWTGDSEFKGIDLENTATNKLMVGPGLIYTRNNLVLETLFQLPLTSNTPDFVPENDLSLTAALRLYL